jgi:hypothetical protein
MIFTFQNNLNKTSLYINKNLKLRSYIERTYALGFIWETMKENSILGTMSLNGIINNT